jgi:CRISPR-associated protein Cas6
MYDDPEVDEIVAADAVDLIFSLSGRTIMTDYAAQLQDELRRCLPWLASEARIGVHPLGGLSPGAGEHLVSGRSKLTVRVPRERADDLQALTGQTLELGSAIAVGRAKSRELRPAAVLYSPFVVFDEMGTADEVAFMETSHRAIGGLGFRHVRLICGKARRSGTGAGAVFGFSLMAHGLRPVESIRLQEVGLGGEHQRGCGIFVQHKSVIAVAA